MDKLARHRQQVIPGKEHGVASRDDNPLVGRRQGRRQAMGTMRRVLTVVAPPPLAHRGTIQVVLAGQFARRLGGFAPLLAHRRRGPRIFRPVQIQGSPASGRSVPWSGEVRYQCD